MMEDGKPFFGLTAPEWHAIAYGLIEGLKFWKRREVLYDQIDGLNISPEWKADLKAKYHYYRVTFDLPEDIALLAFLLYYGSQNMPALMKIGAGITGLPL